LRLFGEKDTIEAIKADITNKPFQGGRAVRKEIPRGERAIVKEVGAKEKQGH
jgi:hypothetical protein